MKTESEIENRQHSLKQDMLNKREKKEKGKGGKLTGRGKKWKKGNKKTLKQLQ